MLVHGISGGSWCWYKIQCLMENSGYKVSTVDVKSAGVDRADADSVLASWSASGLPPSSPPLSPRARRLRLHLPPLALAASASFPRARRLCLRLRLLPSRSPGPPPSPRARWLRLWGCFVQEKKFGRKNGIRGRMAALGLGFFRFFFFFLV